MARVYAQTRRSGWPGRTAVGGGELPFPIRLVVAASKLNPDVSAARDADQDRREGFSRGRYVTFQMAEVAVPRQMFAEILSLIARLRAPPAPAWGRRGRFDKRRQRCAPTQAERHVSAQRRGQLGFSPPAGHAGRDLPLLQDARRDDHPLTTTRTPGNVGQDNWGAR